MDRFDYTDGDFLHNIGGGMMMDSEGRIKVNVLKSKNWSLWIRQIGLLGEYQSLVVIRMLTIQ